MPPHAHRQIVPLLLLVGIATWFVLVAPLVARGWLDGSSALHGVFLLNVMAAALGCGAVALLLRGGREATDDAGRLAAAEQLARANERDLALSVAVNRILVEASSAAELFAPVCRAVVENGALGVWVGTPLDDGRFAVVAHAGEDHGHIDDVDVRWDPAHPAGNGPSGQAFRSGLSIVVDDVSTDPIVAHWRAQLLACGVRAEVAVPLRAEGQALGVISAYWDSTAPLSGRDLACLERVAADLARGLLALDRRNEIAAARARLQAVLDASPYAVLVVDPAGCLVYANPHVAETFGWAPEQVVGGSAFRLAPEADRAIWRERSATYFPAPFTNPLSTGFKERGLRADGSIFPAEVAVGSIVLEGRPHVVLTVVDLTEREALVAESLAAQKLQVMGHLASILAHDLRNYLSGIGGLAALVAETMPLDDERRDDLGLIERTVGEATTLTRNVLAFARPQDAAAVADVADVFRDYLPILERVVGNRVRIQASRDGDLRPVQIEPSALGQVLVNLATNARQAMPEGGELSFEARPSDSGIVIRVRDTGTGMPPEVASRVFEPFFTTRGGEPGPSGGTGLGLSSVHTIVRRAGGQIAVVSKLGTGTTFEITLPLARAA